MPHAAVLVLEATMAAAVVAAPPRPLSTIAGWRYQQGQLSAGISRADEYVLARLDAVSFDSARQQCEANRRCCGLTFWSRDPQPPASHPINVSLMSTCELRCLFGGEPADPTFNAWSRSDNPGPTTFINSGTAGGTPRSFDCASRIFAWEFGKQLQPQRGQFQSLFDALQLGACNVTRPGGTAMDTWSPPYLPVPEGANTFVVSLNGDDSRGQGTAAAPYRSVAMALNAARRAPPRVPRFILLRAGVHVLNGTLQLGPADSFTTIQNYAGEHATLSGGLRLQNLNWKPVLDNESVLGTFATRLPTGVRRVSGLRVGGHRAVRARYPNGNPLNAMQYSALHGWIRQSTVWSPPKPPTKPPVNVWITAADWPGVEWPMMDPKGAPPSYNSTQTGEGGWGAFTLGYGGTCDSVSPPVGYWCQSKPPRGIVPHMHPSGIEVDELILPNSPRYSDPTGGIIHAWRPSHWYTNMYEIGSAQRLGGAAPSPSTNDIPWRIDANTDVGVWRAASVRADTESIIYLGNVSSTAACMTLAHQSNMTKMSISAGHGQRFVGFSYFHLTFTDPSFQGSCYGLASVQDWTQTEHVQMVGVDSGRAPHGIGRQVFNFSRGGDQGGEGEASGAEWYIENIREEMDDANEFFHDEKTQTLYYVVNRTVDGLGTTDGGTDVEMLSHLEFTATNLAVLINVTGSATTPVQAITIAGLELTDTRDVFMEPQSLPSGGDWAVQRSGAIYMTGTRNATVTECRFQRVDGTGVFLGGYHRSAEITKNEFVEIGDSCIVAWGDTSKALNENGSKAVPWPVGPDARAGNQPWDTKIIGNLAHEIGLFQKQSSLFFQAIVARSQIKGNVFFNGPRAAVNANDGHAGGDDVSGNLFVNSCRESGDHGPWNSWDRQPYIHGFHGASGSVIPLTRSIHHNFLIGNYNALFAVDTDDGSSYYDVHHNFLVSAGEGLKSICGSHDMHHHDNIYAYPWGQCWQVSGGAPGTPSWSGGSGFNDSYVNNTCIPVTQNARHGYTGDCGQLAIGFKVSGTRVLTKNGSLSVCGHSLADWQTMHPDREVGTTVAPWPKDVDLIEQATTLLRPAVVSEM